MTRLQRLIRTGPGTRLLPKANSFRLDPEGAREAVLLIHGFTGYPRELEGLALALAEAGYASLAIRLPGHGSQQGDFLASGAEDWLRAGIDGYLESRSSYKKVHVCGHSMGGLIASLVAAAFEAPRLILLAPAFKIAKPGLVLAPLLAPFLPVVKKGRPLPGGEIDPLRRSIFPEYKADDLIGGLAQLNRLRRAATKALSRLDSRILVLLGGEDATVPGSVGPFIKARAPRAASLETRTIPAAGHRFPFEAGSEEAKRIVLEWMAQDPSPITGH